MNEEEEQIGLIVGVLILFGLLLGEIYSTIKRLWRQK